MFKSTVKVLSDIDDERFRQISEEGWTHEHDDQHDGGEMALAASAYALNAGSAPSTRGFRKKHITPPPHWPWDRKWWKPTDRRRDLVKAAALIVAEIERLDRLSPIPTTEAEE